MQNRRIISVSSIAPSDASVMLLGDGLHIHPDVLFSSGGSILGCGVQGSGKTSIMVRILEQAARFHIPMCVWDLEGDLISSVGEMPRGVIGSRTDCPSARDIVKLGLQCVFDLSTWGISMDVKGDFVSRMVNTLYNVVDALPPSQRTPIILGLDECALWLPQRRGEVFSAEIYKALAESWHLVATTGRKRGLVPVLFAQKISEVNKMVLSPGTTILGRQTVHVDQKRYLDYVERRDGDAFCYMTDRQLCQYFSSLQPGTAIVKLANGEQRVVKFYQRASQHISHTPTTQAALNRYANLSFKPARFGAYIGDDEQEQVNEPSAMEQTSATKQTPVDNPHECARRTCHEQATHVYPYNALRATAQGKQVEERYQYLCSKHSNRQCKPL